MDAGGGRLEIMLAEMDCGVLGGKRADDADAGVLKVRREAAARCGRREDLNGNCEEGRNSCVS